MNTPPKEDLLKLTSIDEDTYFLDGNKAVTIAQQQRRIRQKDGQERIQYCYYSGPVCPDAPNNCVAVPISSFVQYFQKHKERIPVKIDCEIKGISASQCQQIENDFIQLLAEVQRRIRPASPQTTLQQFDTFFFDPLQALSVALQHNPVEVGHPRIKGLQICYYTGTPIAENLENLIHIPEDQLLDFFCNTRMRLPQRIVFPSKTEESMQQEISDTFNQVLTTAHQYRSRAAIEIANACRMQQPLFTETKPLRIFLPTNRLTEVMQYCSKNLAKAFRNLGHVAIVSIENNSMESLPSAWHLKEQYDLHPHVVVNINHLNNACLHPHVFNVVWWQDPMPEIMRGQRLPWRDRDIVFSVDPFFDGYLNQVGATEILRQHFCVDTEVFCPAPHLHRRHKLVFVGSSYHDKLALLSEEGRDFLREAVQDLASGRLVSEEEIKRWTNNPAHAMWIRNYIVRDTVVRWACELTHIDVEIYGRGWEYDPVIMSKYKGELPHGEAVAQIYQEASHALVPMPLVLNSQRLAEIAACGCIPVVYDIRHEAEPPHWDKECLFFTTKAKLAACIQHPPPGNPLEIAKIFSYDAMARRIITIIQKKIETT